MRCHCPAGENPSVRDAAGAGDGAAFAVAAFFSAIARTKSFMMADMAGVIGGDDALPF